LTFSSRPLGVVLGSARRCGCGVSTSSLPTISPNRSARDEPNSGRQSFSVSS
jgi:hypothetical protein